MWDRGGVGGDSFLESSIVTDRRLNSLFQVPNNSVIKPLLQQQLVCFVLFLSFDFKQVLFIKLNQVVRRSWS